MYAGIFGMYAEIAYGGTRDVRWDVRWDVVWIFGISAGCRTDFCGMSYEFRTKKIFWVQKKIFEKKKMRNFEKIKKNTKKKFLDKKKFQGQKKSRMSYGFRKGMAYGFLADFVRISWDCVRDGVRTSYGGTLGCRTDFVRSA